jgi:hypothetical protein
MAFPDSTFAQEIKRTMESKTIDHNNLQSKSLELDNTYAKMNMAGVYSPHHITYLNEFSLFMAHFHTIPLYVEEQRIDCKKANKWFLEKYSSDIRYFYYDKRYLPKGRKPEFDDIIYILFEDLVVYLDTNCSNIRFLYRKTELPKVNEIIEGMHRFKKRKERGKPEISLLMRTSEGISTKTMQITKPKLNIEDNYNDDFQDIHKIILKRLSKKNDKGLVVLHGKPGTGKTSYIRYLISSLKKEVIFLPPNMASVITNPDLISVLVDNPNSIFVIEDAENIVVDREKDGSSPVSALLNISDGLLSDCLNVQIICSFNTDISKIDAALMRKGRLIAKYEFNELSIEKAQVLSRKLGFNSQINAPMTLTAIYNQEDREFQQIRKGSPIGFRGVNTL